MFLDPLHRPAAVWGKLKTTDDVRGTMVEDGIHFRDLNLSVDHEIGFFPGQGLAVSPPTLHEAILFPSGTATGGQSG